MANETSPAWITSVSSDAVTGSLQGIYERIRAQATSGRVSHVWQAFGLDAAGLEALFTQYEVLMSTPAPLSTSQAQLLALVVSATNGCTYCVAHHGPRLAEALQDEALAHAVARDYREANLTAQDRVLLDYAVALTCEPSERKLDDIERVREYGFDDDAILKATAITAFYNQLNRIVSGLGVTLEPNLEAWAYGSQK